MKCLVCKGLGYRQIGSGMNSNYRNDVSQDCYACGGTGKDRVIEQYESLHAAIEGTTADLKSKISALLKEQIEIYKFNMSSAKGTTLCEYKFAISVVENIQRSIEHLK